MELPHHRCAFKILNSRWTLAASKRRGDEACSTVASIASPAAGIHSHDCSLARELCATAQEFGEPWALPPPWY
jgi:hypothetical protein